MNAREVLKEIGWQNITKEEAVSGGGIKYTCTNIPRLVAESLRCKGIIVE